MFHQAPLLSSILGFHRLHPHPKDPHVLTSDLIVVQDSPQTPGTLIQVKCSTLGVHGAMPHHPFLLQVLAHHSSPHRDLTPWLATSLPPPKTQSIITTTKDHSLPTSIPMSLLPPPPPLSTAHARTLWSRLSPSEGQVFHLPLHSVARLMLQLIGWALAVQGLEKMKTALILFVISVSFRGVIQVMACYFIVLYCTLFFFLCGVQCLEIYVLLYLFIHIGY